MKIKRALFNIVATPLVAIVGSSCTQVDPSVGYLGLRLVKQTQESDAKLSIGEPSKTVSFDITNDSSTEQLIEGPNVHSVSGCANPVPPYTKCTAQISFAFKATGDQVAEVFFMREKATLSFYVKKLGTIEIENTKPGQPVETGYNLHACYPYPQTLEIAIINSGEEGMPFEVIPPEKISTNLSGASTNGLGCAMPRLGPGERCWTYLYKSFTQPGPVEFSVSIDYNGKTLSQNYVATVKPARPKKATKITTCKTSAYADTSCSQTVYEIEDECGDSPPDGYEIGVWISPHMEYIDGQPGLYRVHLVKDGKITVNAWGRQGVSWPPTYRNISLTSEALIDSFNTSGTFLYDTVWY